MCEDVRISVAVGGIVMHKEVEKSKGLWYTVCIPFNGWNCSVVFHVIMSPVEQLASKFSGEWVYWP